MAIYALTMVIVLCLPPKFSIHHTDRRSRYRSHDCQKLLRQRGLRTSMSGKGPCHYNAAVKTFFKTIKAEMIWLWSWSARRSVEVALLGYINGFYNPRRRDSAFAWKAPGPVSERPLG